MQRYRPALRRAGVLSVAEARAQPNGRRARVAGLPTVRQRPATAKGMVFISLEDETGLIDLVVRPNVYQRQRAVLRGAAVLLADGVVQNANGSASLLLTRADILGE
jgi:error-prone DNA polymerase